MSQAPMLWEHVTQPNAKQATLTLNPGLRSPHKINPLLLGKFCEHLGSNIYNGMEAQILRNPTFGKWCFGTGDCLIDGGAAYTCDGETVSKRLRGVAQRLGLPPSETLLEEDYKDGAALHWMRLGERAQVLLSPDAGPRGGRVQRLETPGATPRQPVGLAQYTPLPLHRTRSYQFRIVARATAPVNAELSLCAMDAAFQPGPALAQATVPLRTRWSTFNGQLRIPDGANLNPNALLRFALSTDTPANIVLARILLYPDDHVHYADPDIIRLLKQAKLPLLRWPGGNFVSGYRWRNGVGPVDLRPTVPNLAWEGLEYNLFGTDEFVQFCREVGCEPMICVNCGDGTPEEAAAWVQYCNGSIETPMGHLRAENGHPEPFAIQYWEIGNEITGRHQIGWTTPGGYIDRYLRFNEAMHAADPSIQTLACGGPWGPEHEWNRRLVLETHAQVRSITDHILTGGPVSAQTNLDELFHAFTGYADALGRQYRAQRDLMLSAGIQQPHLALTELQVFAHAANDAPAAVRNAIPTPASITEALYLTTIVRECIRLGDFVELITHSATVNHGGGLRKTRERAWANPVHYAHLLLSALAQAHPIALRLQCGSHSTHSQFGLIPPLRNIPVLDALAALAADGRSLLISLVHRSAHAGPIALSIDLGSFNAGVEAEISTLSGTSACDQNTAEDPEHITPRRSNAAISGNKLSLTLPPFSVTRVVVPAG